MARSMFGAGVADFVVTPSDGLWAVGAGATVTFWDSADAGTQYTDLLDASSTPITSVTADEFGALPRFSGPDGVTGMWADGGGTSRAWMDAHGGATGGGGGGGAVFTKLIRVVASATAPADVRAAATYLCDGTADQVQIQQAIDDAQSEGGGIVQLSVGRFNLTAPLQINGTANEDNPLSVTIQGMGEWATILKPSTNVNGIAISNWAQCHLERFGIEIFGSGNGIVSTAVTTTDTRSFWDSSFRNLRINGSYTSTNTGWGMDLSMPFRSVFENIEVEGTRNGIRLLNDSTVQNAGDCTFTRMFIEIVGDGGTAIHVSSPSNNMNQNNFDMVEAGANGPNCTGILIDGASGGASQRFWGTNLEQFKTLVNVVNGESNVFDLNYVTCDNDNVTGNKAFICGSNAYGNTFSSKWVNVPSGQTLTIIEDNNTTANVPNVFERIRIENNGGTINYTKQNSTVLREITAFNITGIQTGLLRYPVADPGVGIVQPSDHGLISWTFDPANTIDVSTLASGTVYMAAVRVRERTTLSNISIYLSSAGVTLTAGQNFAGIYNSSGTRLAVTADQASAWASSGAKTMALAAPVAVYPGTYYIALVCNATTPIVVSRGSGNAGQVNIGLTAGTARYTSGGTGWVTQTSLPASGTLANRGIASIISFWAAVS
ncbi:hypothetical protein ACFVFJ_44355 [Streptomyces sp. NPDC057717]|uniref:hypothetical protein n=1 Tax=Streptomyces sp. NPDC057717 TaxID=3346224 RepID=UPI003684415D